MTCKYSNIIIKPQELKFTAQEGYRFVLPYQNIYLEKATHDLTPSWAAATDATWLSIKPTSGKAPERVRVKVDSREMAAGIYHGQIIFNSDVSVSPALVMVILEVKFPMVGPEPEGKPPEPVPEKPEEEIPEEIPEQQPSETTVSLISRILEVLNKLAKVFTRLYGIWKR